MVVANVKIFLIALASGCGLKYSPFYSSAPLCKLSREHLSAKINKYRYAMCYCVTKCCGVALIA